eukprot:TRINITY_DN9699_c0_g1_i1.p1 TRINITY_DN9699_c0_g1~~TRINITY_DN9699_c0_g1_i1.p1  ORF type:complete len:560 (-),score=128.69 TRINITY_DN9699_c0_g1_i1:8-1555(-)
MNKDTRQDQGSPEAYIKLKTDLFSNVPIADEYRFQIIDTQGHGEATLSKSYASNPTAPLPRAEILLLIIDITKWRSASGFTLLRNIKEGSMLFDSIEANIERIVIVLNKIDDKNDDVVDIKDTINNMRSEIKRQCQIDLRPDQIIPFSAKEARMNRIPPLQMKPMDKLRYEKKKSPEWLEKCRKKSNFAQLQDCIMKRFLSQADVLLPLSASTDAQAYAAQIIAVEESLLAACRENICNIKAAIPRLDDPVVSPPNFVGLIDIANQAKSDLVDAIRRNPPNQPLLQHISSCMELLSRFGSQGGFEGSVIPSQLKRSCPELATKANAFLDQTKNLLQAEFEKMRQDLVANIAKEMHRRSDLYKVEKPQSLDELIPPVSPLSSPHPVNSSHECYQVYRETGPGVFSPFGPKKKYLYVNDHTPFFVSQVESRVQEWTHEMESMLKSYASTVNQAIGLIQSTTQQRWTEELITRKDHQHEEEMRHEENLRQIKEIKSQVDDLASGLTRLASKSMSNTQD